VTSSLWTVSDRDCGSSEKPFPFGAFPVTQIENGPSADVAAADRSAVGTFERRGRLGRGAKRIAERQREHHDECERADHGPGPS
jgi:hypothetical protein